MSAAETHGWRPSQWTRREKDAHMVVLSHDGRTFLWYVHDNAKDQAVVVCGNADTLGGAQSSCDAAYAAWTKDVDSETARVRIAESRKAVIGHIERCDFCTDESMCPTASELRMKYRAALAAQAVSR